MVRVLLVVALGVLKHDFFELEGLSLQALLDVLLHRYQVESALFLNFANVFVVPCLLQFPDVLEVLAVQMQLFRALISGTGIHQLNCRLVRSPTLS